MRTAGSLAVMALAVASVPAVAQDKVDSASFEAIGPYPNAGATYINRLAPIPGVLAYGKDRRVLDLKRNVEAVPH